MELQEEFFHLAKVSTHLSPHDAKCLLQWTAGLCLFMEDRSTAFVEKHSQDPILVSFSSDPSSLLLPVGQAASFSEMRFKRTGRELIELLLQRVVYKSMDMQERCDLHIQLGLPLPLNMAIGTNLFKAATPLLRMARLSGHKSIIINHLCCDRAVHSALETPLWGRLQEFYASDLAKKFGDYTELYHLKERFVSMPCSAHAAQNALKWAVTPHLQGDILKDLHIGIELSPAAMPLPCSTAISWISW